MMTKKIALSLALLLSSTSLAGGAGPRAAAPANVAVNPIQTSAATGVLSAADLLRTGTLPVLVSADGTVLARLAGPNVTLAVGSPEARFLIVNRGAQAVRYTLTRPVVAGRTVSLSEVTLVRGSEVMTTPVTPAAVTPSGVTAPRVSSPAPSAPRLATPQPITTQPAPPQPATQPARASQGGSQVGAPGTPGNAPVAAGKVTICHPTSSASNPYTLITISTNALDTHLAQGAFVSSEAQGCPSGAQPGNGNSNSNGGNGAAPTTPANPGNGNGNGGNGNGNGGNGNGGNGAAPATPANPGSGNGEGTAPEKVTICHPTSSASNPYTLITISRNALDTHLAQGAFVSSEAQGCPSGAQPGNGNGNSGNGNGNGGNGAAPTTPGNPGNGNGNGNGNGAPPAAPAQPGKGK